MFTRDGRGDSNISSSISNNNIWLSKTKIPIGWNGCGAQAEWRDNGDADTLIRQMICKI